MLRNDDKFAKRNKATRNRISPDVFCPDTVDMLSAACERLEAAEGKATLVDASGLPVFTDKEVPGIGKNYMKEASRVKAIESYRYYSKYYALKGLFDPSLSAIELLGLEKVCERSFVARWRLCAPPARLRISTPLAARHSLRALSHRSQHAPRRCTGSTAEDS